MSTTNHILYALVCFILMLPLPHGIQLLMLDILDNLTH